jgi:hypothetical protein
VLLVAPLFGRDLGPEAAEVEELPGVRERESIYSAIRDLEHDHETGKIAEADYTAMSEELRARAIDLLRREREGVAAAERTAAPSHCDGCGAEVRDTDRFCSRCGRPLAGSPPGEAEG